MQIAALLGVGLLYQGSAHRLMTEVLLGEIARCTSTRRDHTRAPGVELASLFAPDPSYGSCLCGLLRAKPPIIEVRECNQYAINV